MDTVNALLSTFRSPRYSFRPSEPSLVVRAGKSGVVGEPALSADQAGHGKPITSPDSDFLHVPEPDQQLLSVVGEKMLRTARAAGQPQTLVVMQVYDLPEVELVFGRAAAEETIDEVMTKLTRVATRKGLVVRSAADTFALLVPGSGSEATTAAVAARFGKPCVIEFELDGAEILLVPDFQVHTFESGESVQEVYARLCRVIAKGRGQEQGRCEYLRKEREAYTRPMGLSLKPCSEPRREVYYPVLPATIPVPMGAR